ncbi:MAG: hypothetical protein NDJ89_17610, partial [Oligoflexia bacterium]|nr:hypothetical protein [Oligoflexia bacterium]
KASISARSCEIAADTGRCLIEFMGFTPPFREDSHIYLDTSHGRHRDFTMLLMMNPAVNFLEEARAKQAEHNGKGKVKLTYPETESYIQAEANCFRPAPSQGKGISRRRQEDRRQVIGPPSRGDPKRPRIRPRRGSVMRAVRMLLSFAPVIAENPDS